MRKDDMNNDYSFPEHPVIDPPAEPEPVECLACCGAGRRIGTDEIILPNGKRIVTTVIRECPHCQGQGVLEPESAEALREIRAQEKLDRSRGK